MCIAFFMSHYDGPREHFVSSYHCAYIDCPGIFESHQKYRLEESRLGCSECLAKDGNQVDPDIIPVEYYPPIAHFDIQYVEGKDWVKFCEQGDVNGADNARNTKHDAEDDGEDDGRYAHSFASLSDCDSVTSHWRLDPTFASRVHPVAAATKKKSHVPLYQESAITEETYETRSPHEPPYEMIQVREVSYESASPAQEPRQPARLELPFGDSPNTLEHRNLVNQQLATLEHRMAHRHPRRQPSQPTFNVPRPQRINHQRQNSKRRVAVNRPPNHVIPPPVTPRKPPGPLPGGLLYKNGLHYLVPATPVSGVKPDWRWDPVPAPHEGIFISPW
ncbi:hypothetical protein G6011_11496 [Alternaria panax]|uniref:Uncharacterized protein n=1 Tax=Alternaria panax TaxID=48097 RepID=A0AAD4IDI4_9PLEO|nr:hypothetical protein G6011_11496 [Alternaria panax]